MIRARQTLALLASASVLSIALASCGGGGSQGQSMALPQTPASGGSTSNASIASTFSWGSDALKGATYVGPAKFAAMGVNVGLRLQNEAGLVSYAQSVSNPHSALYRHFLSPAEIGQRYGASTSDYATTAQYFASNGLHVGGWPQHLMLYVSGTQSQLENAFHTTFGVYRSASGSTFVAPTGTPSFGKALAVSAVGNLVTKANDTRQFVRVGNADTGGYSPAQIRKVFDYVGAYAAGYTGTGINVGIIGTGPISPADVPAFASTFHVQAATVSQVNATDQGVASGLALNSPAPNPSATPPYTFPFTQGLTTPPPATGSCSGSLPACNMEDVEAQIDTEQAATLAPGSSVLFYLAYNPGECFISGPAQPAGSACPAGSNNGNPAAPAIGLPLADDEIQQAISDDTADILSLSYGGPEISDPSVGLYGAAGFYFDPSNPSAGFGPAEFAALAAEGIAVFVSSGDLGAEQCKGGFTPLVDDLCVSYPASDVNVVAVGGVTTPMDQFGNLTNQITAWGVQTNAGVGGSGGGVSAFFQQPAFQNGIPGVQGTTRNLPDVALEGDPATGISVLVDATLGGPAMGSVGGTSVAAPEMAAMWALVLQACKQSATCSAHGSGAHPYRLGDPNPLLYPIYYANSAVQPTYATTFYDVLYGNNALDQGPVPQPGATLDPGYNAGVGYDLVTGLGVPFGDHLINAILNAESN